MTTDKIIFLIFVSVFLTCIICMLVGALIYHVSKGKMLRKFYHDTLGWHIPTTDRGFDGCSFHSTCKICGQDIMQDSQGNWF